MRRHGVPVAALLLLLSPGIVRAQQVRLQGPSGPQYLGAPVELRIIATGFEEKPEPEVSVPSPAHGRLELAAVHPNISSSITVINGVISQSKKVEFVYVYRYLASQTGAHSLGPFTVSQGGTRVHTGTLRVELREVPQSDRVRVALVLPEKPRYVGQRIPIRLEFWLEQDVRKNLHQYTLHAPLFDDAESFRFLDDPTEKLDTEVKIQTAAGELKLPGRVRETTSGGKRYAVVSVERTLVPLRAGRFTLEPTTFIVDEATRWTRDFFGGRRATHVRKLRATDRPRFLEVRSLPARGQPETFAGAVGRGFSLEVTADRSVVQVGDPITLTITLRGEGNLETAALPSLDAEGFLPRSTFRVPSGETPGEYSEGTKSFTVQVRVMSEHVREIPALEYAWFDADEGAYQVTHSQPIALSVRPAEVIGADDVVRVEEQAVEEVEREVPDDVPASAFPHAGADLAIELDVEVLSRPSTTPGGPWLPAGLYTGASLLLAAALWDRRRRNVDPALVRRRRRLERECARIREAPALPPTDAVAELARALRSILAEIPEATSDELDAFLAECDARSYAPVGRHGDSGLDEAFHRRALVLAEAMT